MGLELPPAVYCELRRQASLADSPPGELAAAALSEWLEES
jgi:hypothetical protein